MGSVYYSEQDDRICLLVQSLVSKASFSPSELIAAASEGDLTLSSSEEIIEVSAATMRRIARWLYEYGRVPLRPSERARRSALAC